MGEHDMLAVSLTVPWTVLAVGAPWQAAVTEARGVRSGHAEPAETSAGAGGLGLGLGSAAEVVPASTDAAHDAHMATLFHNEPARWLELSKQEWAKHRGQRREGARQSAGASRAKKSTTTAAQVTLPST